MGRQTAFEPFGLTGKRALVTGSSQSIALAQGLAEHGAEIVLNGRDKAAIVIGTSPLGRSFLADEHGAANSVGGS
jgi:NAD(P)-dependent dehydrogenase (short-subunit alcohol dehydrogenase family)